MSNTTGTPYARDPRATGSTVAGGPSSSGPSTTDTAKEQAAGVAGDAGRAGQHVAGVTKDQAADVIGEARRQASDLLGQGRTQLAEQSTAGQQRAASGLSSLATELKDLAEGRGGSGIATDLAHQASQRVEAAGTWLTDREPADVLREVQSFARRRPVTFLAIAAGVGLVAGRLTRGIAAASHDEAPGSDAAAPAAAPTAPAAPTATTAPIANADQALVTGTTDPVYGTTPSHGAAPTDATTGLRAPGRPSWDGPRR
jgi:hypothetical protein